MSNFVHLHLHSQFSLLDGAARLDRVFSKCASEGMPAVAITDHGNMFGAVEVFKAAAKITNPKADFDKFASGEEPYLVKPIIGCEVYACDDRHSRDDKNDKYDHLVLLCKDETGYKNLVKMVSLAYTEGFYSKPRIDYELLKDHSEGLVCLSACLSGRIPKLLLAGEYQKAKDFALMLKGVFLDDFYIEIQNHGLSEQKLILPSLVKLSRETSIPLVATNDVHYVDRKDAEIQRILQCVSYRTTIERFKAEKQGFTTDEFYLKTEQEMAEAFPALPEALSNSLVIADKCNFRMNFTQKLLPEFDNMPKGEDAASYLTDLARRGLCQKYGAAEYSLLSKEVRERAEYELDVIISLGFADYYLIVWDFIHYAERHDVPVGPGRGSGVGSLIAYAVGITKVDPLKFNLIFERFLNRERVSNPDFDIDFCYEGREQVISYVVDKYGADKVAQIVTFGTLASRAAVKDVGRVLGIPYSETDRITKIMGMAAPNTPIEQLLGLKMGKNGENKTVNDLVELYNTDSNARRVLDIAVEVEGMPRNTSKHAAGVVICKEVISDHVPLQKTGEDITTQFNMIEVEKLGMLKMDFLGLRTLTDIKKTQEMIKKAYGISIDFYNMEYTDPEVYAQVSSGFTHGVFQLEGAGMRSFMHDLQPSCIEDIIAGIALYRPGPMGEIGNYVAGKRAPDRVKYDHPVLEHILKVTYGVIIYQEQVMQIVRELAGYSYGRADIVRRIMSKKKGTEMDAERAVFLGGDKTVEGALKKGIPEDVANKVFDKMAVFADYAFNKSHATAYAYLAYQTAYLLHYYPVEYMAAVLNNRLSKLDEVKHYLAALKEMKIALLPPDINRSYSLFTVDYNGLTPESGLKPDPKNIGVLSIRAGLAAIKNVGQAAVDAICGEREQGGEYTDFYDFVYRQRAGVLNRKMVESLIYAGAFDGFKRNRRQLLMVYEKVMDKAAKEKGRIGQAQITFFDLGKIAADDDRSIDYPKVDELDSEHKLKFEKDVLGVYISGHPLDKYVDELAKYRINTSMFMRKTEEDEGFYFSEDDDTMPTVTDKAQVALAGIITDVQKKKSKTSGNDMAIATLEDLHGTIKIMLNGRKYANLKGVIKNDLIAVVKGSLSLREDDATIFVDDITPINAQEKPEASKKLYVRFPFSENLQGKIDTILADYEGADTVFYCDTSSKDVFKCAVTVRVCNPLLNELYALLGEANVKSAT